MIICDNRIRRDRPNISRNAMELTYVRNCCTTSRNPIWFSRRQLSISFPPFFLAALKFWNQNLP